MKRFIKKTNVIKMLKQLDKNHCVIYQKIYNRKQTLVRRLGVNIVTKLQF